MPVRQVRFSSFDAFQAIPGAASKITQLEPGQLAGMMSEINLDQLTLTGGSFSRGMVSRGVLATDRWLVGGVRSEQPVKYARFNEHRNGDVVIGAPSIEHHTRYLGATDYWALVVEEAELQDFLDSAPGLGNIDNWRKNVSVLLRPADPAIAEQTAREIAKIIDAIVAAKTKPSTDAAQYYRRAVLDLALCPATTYVKLFGDVRLTRAWALIRDIDDYLSAEGHRPVHIAELCRKFRVTRRSLHRTFQERLGIGPIAYLRSKRLNAVRAELLSGRVFTVQDVALEYGFVELGRFSRIYRQQFGELPSVTLRRAGSASAPLAWSSTAPLSI
ncbi:helix-turn-helix domain-containing protein [Bradyrhizobium sp. USDA 4508]